MSEGSDTGSPTLRSRAWFGGNDVNSFAHRAWLKSQGYTSDTFDERPVIGIVNSWSEATPCNGHLRALAERVKRGVWREGGFPIEIPVMSLGEVLMKPTTMLYRNLMALEVEENVRAYPFDGVVMMSGCDKTTVGMLLGAASGSTPAIILTGGPMLRGMRGSEEAPGATELWRASMGRSDGSVSDEVWEELESCVTRSAGHCGVMGTASTMATISEALGMTLPGCAAIPAVDARRNVIAEETGRRAVNMVLEDLTPDKVLTEKAFENAIAVLMAVGGSTNGVIHLQALARRAGVDLPLETFDRISQATPVIADLQPVGRYQMEDFFYAGGIPAVMAELGDLLHGEAMTVTGKTMGEELKKARNHNPVVIRSRDSAVQADGGLAILRGNLCPDGAVIKHSAASPALLKHVGKAVVFQDKKDMLDKIHKPDLEVDADSVLILQNAGPIGGPGMPEWGMLPIPDKLAREGVQDMVRISDARMSGTSFGTCVLHVAPESAIGGPLGLVRTGDLVELDVSARTLNVLIDPAEMAARREAWAPAENGQERGYIWLYKQHVLQANEGADFDFTGGSTPASDPLYDPGTY